MYKLKQKGAIFGVDARITIVILAIITATFFFKGRDIIADYRNESILDQVEMLRQAVQQRIVDNGFDYVVESTAINDNIFGVSDLDPSVLTANRNKYSYITEPDFASTVEEGVISTPIGVIEINLKSLLVSSTEDGVSAATTQCSNDECYYWIELNNVPEDYFTLLENKYDGETSDADAFTTGIIVTPGQTLATYTGNVLVKVGDEIR